MPFIVNLCFFVLVSAALFGSFILPFANLHMANASLAALKTEVNVVLNKKRHSLIDVEKDLEQVLAKHKSFKEVSVSSSQANDFKVIELEFKYNSLFQDMNDTVAKQKMRFIINDV